MDKPQAMPKACGTVVPHIMGDTPGLVSRLHLLEQQNLVIFFDAEKRVQMMVLSNLKVQSPGRQTAVNDEERAVGMIVPQLGNTSLGGMAFAVMVARAVLLHEQCRHYRMDNHRV